MSRTHNRELTPAQCRCVTCLEICHLHEGYDRGAAAYRWDLIAQEIEEAITAAAVRRAYAERPPFAGCFRGADAAEFAHHWEA